MSFVVYKGFIMYETITIKQYDSLSILCRYTEDDGTVTNLTGTKVEVDVKTLSGILISNLIVDASDIGLGEFTISSDLVSIYPGKYLIDILFTDLLSEDRVASETFQLLVNPSITIPRGI